MPRRVSRPPGARKVLVFGLAAVAAFAAAFGLVLAFGVLFLGTLILIQVSVEVRAVIIAAIGAIVIGAIGALFLADAWAIVFGAGS